MMKRKREKEASKKITQKNIKEEMKELRKMDKL